MNKEIHPNFSSDHMFLKIALPIIIGGLALCSALLSTLLYCHRKRNSRTADTTARSVLNGNNYPRVSYAELARATDNFTEDNLIGAGKYGSVYRGTLSLKAKGSFVHEDVEVAVKVFDLRQFGASKTFVSEIEALRSVKHRNLINIITCCSSIDADAATCCSRMHRNLLLQDAAVELRLIRDAYVRACGQ